MISRDAENRYRRDRYVNDPEYRARVLAAQKARHEQRNARRRARYRHDDEYRAEQIAAARQYREREQ